MLFLTIAISFASAQTNIPVRIFPEHLSPTGYINVAIMPDGSRVSTPVQWPDYPRINDATIDCVRYESLYPDMLLIRYYHQGDIVGVETNTACYKLDLERQLQSVDTQRTVYVATYVDQISGKTNTVLYPRPRQELMTPSIATYTAKSNSVISAKSLKILSDADTVRTQRMERAKSVRGYSVSNDGKKEIIRYFDGSTKTNAIRKVRGYTPVNTTKGKKK